MEDKLDLHLQDPALPPILFAHPRDLWTEICEVTHDYIDASSRDKTPGLPLPPHILF